MQLNAEGFFDEVLLFYAPEQLNDILNNFNKDRNKTSDFLNLAVKYGFSLAQVQI